MIVAARLWCRRFSSTAGELRRLAVEHPADLQQLGDPGDAPFDLGFRHGAHAQSEGQIAADRHRRIKRVGLEDHRDPALARLALRDLRAADLD